MSKIGNKICGFSPMSGFGLNDTIFNLDNRISTDFDGIDDNAQVASSATLNPESQDFAISFWYKSDDSIIGYLISKITTGQGFYVVKVSNVFVCVIAGALDSVTLTHVSSVAFDNKWHHIAVSLNAGVEAVLYIDGARVFSEVASGMGNIANTIPFNIASTSGGVSSFLRSLIDEVVIWKGSFLNNADVLKIHNNGLASNPLNQNSYYSDGATKASNVKMYLRMGDGDTYPFLTDNSPNSNDGILINMDSGDFVNNVPK